MQHRWFLAILALPLLPTTAGGRALDEGMWLPTTVTRGPGYESLVAKGLELAPGEIWSDDGPSLGDAMVMFGRPDRDPSDGIGGFGSGSFVSSQGLLLTNHHVAFDALTSLSSPAHDYVKDGFVAATRDAELSCDGLAVQITTAIRDVTDRVLAGVEKRVSEVEREQQVAGSISKVLENTRQDGEPICTILPMRLGTRYYLFVYEVLRDIRLVYAPPQMIGEYGGDTDNWMWPRHTGDFTYLRAYVSPAGEGATYHEDNVPYCPKRALKLSLAGYHPGDFCFIMGHPGTTWRYRTSYSVNYRETVSLPQQIEFFTQQLSTLEEQAKQSREQAIRLGSTIKQFHNALKNNQGMIDGLDALDVVERRQQMEVELQAWIDADSGRKARYGEILPTLRKLYAELQTGGRSALQGFGPKVTPIRRLLANALSEWRGELLYSDANMTLRLTDGEIRGYSPKDAVRFAYYTSLGGILEKHTGVEPFDAPDTERTLIDAKDWGRYGDKELGTVPACFLSDTDITGGNSGSPIMNARGEMIGIAFDGNYEAMTSDFTFEDAITRTINVDIRYVLWCTDKLAGLDRLLNEMELVGG